MINIDGVINAQRNSAPTGANDKVDEMKLEVNEPLGGAACSASSLLGDFEIIPLSAFESARLDRELEYIKNELPFIQEEINYLARLLELKQKVENGELPES